MRAVALRVNDVNGLAGFVIPGMHVDVLISGTPPNNPNPTAGAVAKTLLQNIEILSAGQNIQKDAEGKPVVVNLVNVLVTPDQAEVLNLATNDTRVQLVLRNPIDHDTAVTKGAWLQELYTGALPKGAAAARPGPKVDPPPPAAPAQPRSPRVPLYWKLLMAHTVPRRYLRNNPMNPKTVHRIILATLCILAVCAVQQRHCPPAHA